MAGKPKNNTSALMIRISPELKERFENVAEQNSMNVSEYLRFLILEDIRKHEDTPS